ncbi:MAG: zinc-ribbon domain-containing protein [Fimbriimonadaceae bacterium]|nr:zinc-ribbon domain-containing protein [Fimbriimonadaceae bacterium]
MAQFCRQCGAALKEGARFCNSCGAAASSAGPLPTASPGVANIPPPPGVPRVAGGPSAAPFAAPVIAPSAYGAYAPTDAPPGSIVARGREFAAAAARSVPTTGPLGKVLQRAIRATFLDPDAYHEVAANPTLNGEAALLAVVALVSVAVGPALLSALGGLNLTWLLSLVLVQAVALAAFVAAVGAASNSIVGTKLDYGVVFRTTAYAQAVGVLGLVPVVGQLMGLWRLATMTIALKTIGRCETGKAITLLIVGGIGGAVASAVVTPIVWNLVGGTGGFMR